MPHIQPTPSMMDRVKVCTIGESTEYWLWGTFGFRGGKYAILSVREDDNNHALPFILQKLVDVGGAQQVRSTDPALNPRLYNLADFLLHAQYGLPHITCMKKRDRYVNTAVIGEFMDGEQKIFIFRLLDDILKEMEGEDAPVRLQVAEQPEPGGIMEIIDFRDPRLPRLLSRVRFELEENKGSFEPKDFTN